MRQRLRRVGDGRLRALGGDDDAAATAAARPIGPNDTRRRSAGSAGARRHWDDEAVAFGLGLSS